MGYIVDLSHHQDPKKINYDKFARQLDFAIVRTQYGSLTIDRHYKTHHAELRKRGVPTAAYAWVRGVSEKDMQVEATDFYNRTLEAVEPTFWFLDVEEMSMPDMRAGVKAYVKKLRALGAKKVGVYIGHHLYKRFNLDMDDFDAVWIPHYGRNTGKVDSKPAYPCDLHQYTSKGRLDGYSGNLDLNRLMGTKPLEFFIGKKKEKEVAKTYKINKGDTFWDLENKFGLKHGTLQKLNPGVDPRKLRIGQVIKIGEGKADEKEYYTIKKGDTFWELENRLKLKHGTLQKLNPGVDPRKLRVGQKIRVK